MPTFDNAHDAAADRLAKADTGAPVPDEQRRHDRWLGIGYSVLALAEAAGRIADAFEAANKIQQNDPRRYGRGPAL